jgi:hypothetical protein
MARILALFALAPAADPKSLLGAIDVRTLQDVGKSQFFNFENSIFKFQTFLKKHFSEATVNLIQNISVSARRAAIAGMRGSLGY